MVREEGWGVGDEERPRLGEKASRGSVSERACVGAETDGASEVAALEGASDSSSE